MYIKVKLINPYFSYVFKGERHSETEPLKDMVSASDL